MVKMYYAKKSTDGWPEINGNQVIVTSKNCSSEIMNYRITIRREFYTPEELIAAAEWAEMCCIGPWLIGCVSSGFTRKEDATHFKLTWS